MRLLLLCVALLSCTAARPARDARVVDFFVDPVGKVYYLRGDSYLTTANPLGGNDYVFFDSSLGRPDLVDVTNPFAILVHYAEYGQVVILDRTLSELGRRDLLAVEGLLQPGAVAKGNPGGIWIFDSWDYRLKLLADNGSITHRSNDLRLELGLFTEPDHIYVDRDNVYLHYVDQRLLAAFSNYGRYGQTISLPAGDRFGWYAPYLTGRGEDQDWFYHTGHPTPQSWARPRVQGEEHPPTPQGGGAKGGTSKILRGKDRAYELNGAGVMVERGL